MKTDKKIEEILGRHERDDVFGITQELLHLIQEERKEAKEEARMELEVEVGLQNFGQLRKEKNE